MTNATQTTKFIRRLEAWKENRNGSHTRCLEDNCDCSCRSCGRRRGED